MSGERARPAALPLVLVAAAACALVALACGEARETSQLSALQGEPAPTVFRSTLDGRPRVLTAHLGGDVFAAWDLERGVLFEVWRGGVELDGAVYTGRHGPQPRSAGPAWLRSRHPVPWQLRAAGRMRRAAVRYRGHELPPEDPGTLVLRYDLRVEGSPLTHVVERVRLDASEPAAIERSFRVEPEGALVALDLALGALDPERDVETNGQLESRAGLRETEHHARLRLRPAGETRLTIRLHGEPSLARPDPARRGAPPGQLLVEQSDCLVCHGLDHATTGPALRAIATRYAEDREGAVDGLVEKVVAGGTGVWGAAVMTPHPHLARRDVHEMVTWILALEGGEPPEDDEPLPSRGFFAGWGEFFAGVLREISPENAPGDGLPVPGVHPSFDLEDLRPDGFAPRVGGLDFLSDGRLVVVSWDPVGGVYLVDGLQGEGVEPPTVKRIAAGLAEPLGVRVVDDDVYVLQKPELTRLVDRDGDDLIDAYETVSRSWQMTTNFHEFAFGLAYGDGFFYATLATAILPGGASALDQASHRGRVVRIPREDGPLEFPAFGLRTPNGIGLVGYGPDERLYVTDNQGDWLPSSKLLALAPSERDVFFGSRSVVGDAAASLRERPPVVWLPQGEIANSPGQPLALEAGPYRGQLLVTDVTHGGLKRVFVESVSSGTKAGNVLQGTVFRFSQGFEAGVNRAVWGPHGRLYVGGIGSNGNWGQADKERFGLQRLTWNGHRTFEMLAVRSKTGGLEIEWTVPVVAAPGAEAFRLSDWRYVPTEKYGGPKVDERSLAVEAVRWSDDGRRAQLSVPSLEAGRVAYLRLAPDAFRDASGQGLWSTEAWVTLNALPAEVTR